MGKFPQPAILKICIFSQPMAGFPLDDSFPGFFHLAKELREFCGKQFQPCDSRRAPQVGTGLLVVVGDIAEPTPPPPKGSQIVRESSKIETQAEAFQANFWQVCIKS